MLAKMGVGRGDTPEVSPLLRAEDGRVGEATRDAAPVEDDQDSPSTSGWFASRGARVATAAVLGVMVIGCVVGGVTMRTISLATHDTSSGARLPERAHRHRPEGVSDLPEVFVVTGEDAEGPIGEWLRVDEETKAKMEAEARRKMETKKAKAAAKLAKAARKAGPHRGHAEAAVGEAQLVQDLTLSSEDDAAKLAKYNEDKAFKNALETDAGGGLHGGHHLVREDLEDANAVHVVEHPTTRAQRAELEALKKQEENMAEVEEREREWARQQRLEAAEETPSTPSADAVRTASGDVSSSRVLSRVGYSGEDAARDAAKDGGDVWATTDLDPAKASCAASLRDPDVPTKPLFDAGLYFNPNRPDGDPGTRGDFGPRARAVRDTTFASALYLGVPDEDVADRVAAARDAACNAGRARLNLHFFAENDAMCRFVKAHYVAGREASERAANDGPTSTDPATPMPRLGGGRFDCVARAAAALPLQPPKAPLANAPEGAACGNARAAAPWYNKAAFVVETADAARSGAIPQTTRYAWFDADQPGSTLLQALLEHPFDADASESMPTRVHFKCHASAAREQQAVDPCGARAGFVAPKLFVGSELAARKLAKRFAAYARAYLPLEDTAGDWRYARGYFDDYTRINFEDVEAETPLVESPIVANGETGAWSCPCPTEEYALNRLWNDELFPGENDASALPEEMSAWGGAEAVAAVGGGFELQPGLKLMDRDVRVVLPTAETGGNDSAQEETEASEDSSDGSASDQTPTRRAAALGGGFEDPFAEAAAMMNVAAALAGDASAMQELEKLKAQRESPAEEAARLAEEMAFARENPPEAPKVDLSTREHRSPEINKAGSLIDAEADSRDAQCARAPEKPTSFAELPSMGLRKWHF